MIYRFSKFEIDTIFFIIMNYSIQIKMLRIKNIKINNIIEIIQLKVYEMCRIQNCVTFPITSIIQTNK